MDTNHDPNEYQPSSQELAELHAWIEARTPMHLLDESLDILEGVNRLPGWQKKLRRFWVELQLVNPVFVLTVATLIVLTLATASAFIATRHPALLIAGLSLTVVVIIKAKN